MFDDNKNFFLERARTGDEQAFTALYLAYRTRVSNVIRRHIKNQQDIEDLIQLVFFRAYQGLKNFRGDAEFFTWIYSITMNCIRFHARKETRRFCFLPEMDELSRKAIEMDACHEDGPEAICIAVQQKMEVMGVIRNFPPFLGEIFMLRESEGLSYAEIARRMNCPVGTVKSRLHRARESIMMVLEKHDEFGGETNK